MKRLVNMCAVSIIAILVSCGGNEKKETQAHETAKVDSLKVMAISARCMPERLQLPGTIEPFEFVQIFPKVNGFVKTVYVDRGTEVRKGTLLMTLDAPEQMEHMAEAKQKYTEATAMLQNSKDKYERLTETSKTPGTVAPHDITVAHSRMTADDALVQGALANYKAQQAIAAYLTIRAPFDGVISERNVHPGALVGQANTKPMLVLQQQNKFRLTINLPEQYSSQIKEGDVVTYTVSALPGKEFTGVVARSSGALSDKYRTESIEVDVPNKDGLIKPGMHAEVLINAKGNGCAFLVPKKAVVITTERKYVVKVDNGITKWVDVTTGNQSADSTEIFGPLKAGDVIVTKANYDIGNGVTADKAGISVNP